MPLKQILVAASICLGLEGCQTPNLLPNVFHGEPIVDDHVWLLSPPSPTPGQPDALDAIFLPPPCVSNNEYAGWQTSQINACVYAMRQLIDVRFDHYQDSLLGAESGGSAIADLSIVGMGAAGGLVGGATSQILNAASAAVAGAEAKINNDVLYSKSIAIILQQMKTDRATQGTIIAQRLQTSSSNSNPYTNMYDAANDLYKYARAGSWTEALLSLQSQTGSQAQACTQTENQARAGKAPQTPAGQAPCPTTPNNATH